MTSPLPPITADPAAVAAENARNDFFAAAQSIRRDIGINALQEAEQINEAWTAANAELVRLFADLQARRQARLEVVERTVPLGPPVTDDTTPADRIVIMQAWRAALSTARQAVAASLASPEDKRWGNTLEAMLDDSERFDDEVQRRAVLTAAYEQGRTNLIRSWTDMRGLTAQLNEVTELQNAIAGRGAPWNGWNYTLFHPIETPPEVANLPQLQAAEQAMRDARTASIRGANIARAGWTR